MKEERMEKHTAPSHMHHLPKLPKDLTGSKNDQTCGHGSDVNNSNLPGN
jgi:hypothetical protein